VLEFYRSVTQYLNIIKYLGGTYRIGVFRTTILENTLIKNQDAQNNFLELCVEYGADVLKKGDHKTRLLIIPQRPFCSSAISEIKRIEAIRRIGLFTLAWAGMTVHDKILSDFSLEKIMVIDLSFFEFLIDARDAIKKYEKIEVIEVGLPFNKYPLFPEFSADYILVMPTPFSFAHQKDKRMFLEAVLDLFEGIPLADKIVHKSHNGMSIDQFSSIKIKFLLPVLLKLPFFKLAMENYHKIKTKYISDILEVFHTEYLYQKVLKRTVPLHIETEYNQLALEAFLPGIKKGVIGGASNTIWGTLFSKIPFYNCVDFFKQDRNSPNKLYGKKNPGRWLDLNLQYFYVPFCEGKLTFNKQLYETISEKTRNSDLIHEIDREIKDIQKK